MNSLLIFWIVVIAVLKGFELARPSRRRSSRRRRYRGPEDENMGALLWEGMCQAIEEKAPWVFVVIDVLFWVFLALAGWWVLSHWI